MTELHWFILIGTTVFCGVILLAAGSKWLEFRAAQTWPSTQGRVRVSQVTSRRRKGTAKGEFVVENVPLIEYDFAVGRKTVRASRVSIGEVAGNADVEQTLQRYPVGKEVTVYFNPKNPSEAVLEREWPAFVTAGLAILLAFFAGGGFLILFTATTLPQWIAPHLPHPERATLVAMVAGMAAFVTLMGEAIRRQANKTRSWPSTPGRIVASQINTRMTGRSRRRPLYSTEIVFTYQVNGRDYKSSRFSMSGGHFESNIESLAQSALAEYPIGRELPVFYDPENPSESVLNRSASGAYVVWLIAAALWVLLYFLATYSSVPEPR